MSIHQEYSPVDIENYGGTVVAQEINSGTTSRGGKTKHAVFGHTSHFWVDDHESYQGEHTYLLRSLFIQKVYNILCAQLLLTVSISLLFMNVENLRLIAINNSRALVMFSAIGSFGTLLALMSFKDSYPHNFYLLTIFTVFESIMIGMICAIYAEVGLGSLIVQAFAITTMVFLLLTLFARTTYFDFTPYTGLFASLLFAMMIWGFFAMIFGFSPGIIYSWLGVLIFSGFIVIDTQMIIQRFGYDDYIIATIELYLDIINMFLQILTILSSNEREN